MKTQEIKHRITVLTRVNQDRATTFRGLFRVVMKELKSGNSKDKMIYKAIKVAGSKKIKLWIDEAIQ